MGAKKPVALIILDGFGLSENKEGNAVEAARKPTIGGYGKTVPLLL